MYCRNCSYPLIGLPGTTCPECARPFEPSNPRTYDETPNARRRRRLLGPCLLGVAWLSAVGAVVTMVVLVAIIFGGLVTGAIMDEDWAGAVVMFGVIFVGLVVISIVGFGCARVSWR